MLTDSYLKAAAAHDREVEDRAPYNQPDGDIDLTVNRLRTRMGFGDLQRHYAYDEEDGQAMGTRCALLAKNNRNTTNTMTNNFDEPLRNSKADVRAPSIHHSAACAASRSAWPRPTNGSPRCAHRAMLMSAKVQDFSPADRREAMT